MEYGPIDYSQLSMYNKCKRKFYYVYRRGLQYKVGPAAHWSKYLIHEPLSQWWLSGGSPVILWGALYEKFITANDGKFDDYYTLELAQAAIRTYTQQFSKDFENYEVITSETTKTVMLGGFQFLTKPDLVLLRRSDQKIFVKDFKTSRQSKMLIVFDRQFLGQVIGFQAHGFSIDACKLSVTKKGMTTEWYRDEDEVRADLMDEWTKESIMDIADIQHREKYGIWTKSAPDACVEFGDRYVCPFKGICEAGELKEQLIEGWEKSEDPWGYQKQ